MGATATIMEAMVGDLVSIHAPVMGATLREITEYRNVLFRSTRP